MGGWTGAGELDQRISVLSLQQEGTTYRWAEERRWWAKAVEDEKSNLFSQSGTGGRNVTFTVRKNRGLTLHNAFLWRGRHCFLTSILPQRPGLITVRAAIVEIHDVQSRDGRRFPGILTEKALDHEQREPMSVNLLRMVLIVPKAVSLHPGGLVLTGGNAWEVLVPHESDPYRNEYEIGRTVDL